ncbi:lipoprotein [Williamsoniiplasma lucivorax]|uniref:Lipoprotein n=1 Tax=Williamsoniiplasma lucivorax TaxID=209274 RepID=A0A2S5RE78_9MOLU|nr:lipoprotein [Williamsoniiplasma lucivorax]PPE05435.1 hypothetical protein ELUCI_v1c05270 [Williamsoniiplasma lucivorax]
MKKLLSILSGVSMVATTALTVVACSGSTEEDTTGSTFIDGDGDLKITAESLLNWVRENSIGVNNIAKMKEFFQFFAVGLLSDPSFLANIEPTTSAHQYALEGMQAKLQELWGTPGSGDSSSVNGKVQNAWIAKEKKYKDDHGEKKYKETLQKDLHKQFPWVKNNYDDLAKAWKNNEILTNTEYGAYAMLTNTLLVNSSKSVNTNLVNETNIGTALTAFKTAFGGIQVKDLSASLTSATLDQKNIILNLINMTGGTAIIAPKTSGSRTQTPTTQSWSLNNIKFANKDTEITSPMAEDLINRLFKEPKSTQKVEEINFNQGRGTGVEQHWTFKSSKTPFLTENSSYFDLISEYPNLDEEQIKTNDDSYVYGLLTNSQRFLMDEYFKKEKPVSVSEVVFKSTKGESDKNITGSNFLNATTIDPKNWQQYYGLINFLENYVIEGLNKNDDKIPGSSLYKFDAIFANSDSGKKDKIWTNKAKTSEAAKGYLPETWDSNNFELKAPNTLISMNNPGASSIQKYAVYDFIGSGTKAHADLDATGDFKDLPGKYEFTDPVVTSSLETAIGNINDPTLNNEVKQSLFKTLNLIKSLDRRDPSKDPSPKRTSGGERAGDPATTKPVYQVLNAKQGIIAFVDKDGLHITKINGFELINKDLIKEQTSFFFNNNKEKYLQEVSQLKQLLELNDAKDAKGLRRFVFQDYSDAIWPKPGEGQQSRTEESGNGQTPTKPDDFVEQIIDLQDIKAAKDIGVGYSSINSAITNPYEKFLVNNSILNGTGDTTKSFYGFDIFAEMKKEMTENDKDANKLSKNNIWLWNYIKAITGIEHNNKLMDKMFKFDATNKESQRVKKRITDLLVTLDDASMNNPRNAYFDGKTKWDQDIDDTVNAMKDPVEKGRAPISKLPIPKADKDYWYQVAFSEAFEPFKSQPKTAMALVFDIDSKYMPKEHDGGAI